MEFLETAEESLSFVGLDERGVVGGLVVSQSLLDVSLVKLDDVVLNPSSGNGVVEKGGVGAERFEVWVGNECSLCFGDVGTVDGPKKGVSRWSSFGSRWPLVVRIWRCCWLPQSWHVWRGPVW